jgi:hypothetical protein
MEGGEAWGGARAAAPGRLRRMTHPLHDVPTGPNPPHELTAFIEIPRGSRNKYELDKDTGILKLDRILFAAVHYPGDWEPVRAKGWAAHRAPARVQARNEEES